MAIRIDGIDNLSEGIGGAIARAIAREVIRIINLRRRRRRKKLLREQEQIRRTIGRLGGPPGRRRRRAQQVRELQRIRRELPDTLRITTLQNPFRSPNQREIARRIQRRFGGVGQANRGIDYSQAQGLVRIRYRWFLTINWWNQEEPFQGIEETVVVPLTIRFNGIDGIIVDDLAVKQQDLARAAVARRLGRDYQQEITVIDSGYEILTITSGGRFTV